jgi:hypothetical protein
MLEKIKKFSVLNGNEILLTLRGGFEGNEEGKLG